MMPSVAILSAGLRVVVAPWHGHHVPHISTPWKDCSPVVGVLVTACWVVLNLLLSLVLTLQTLVLMWSFCILSLLGSISM